MTNLVREGEDRGRVRGTCLEGPCSALRMCGDTLGVYGFCFGYSRLTRVPGRGNGVGGGCEGSGSTAVLTRHNGLVGNNVRFFGLTSRGRNSTTGRSGGGTLSFFTACVSVTVGPVFRGRGLLRASAMLPRVTCCTDLTTTGVRSCPDVLGCTPCTRSSGRIKGCTVRFVSATLGTRNSAIG